MTHPSTTQMLAARLPQFGITPSDERAVDHDEEPCAICAGPSRRGVPIEDEMKSTTTDQGNFRSPESAYVCLPCVFVRSRISPVPGREAKEGKKYGGCWRNYSVFVDETRIETASKGEKPKILRWLREPKTSAWSCGIADSGQKHVIMYAPVNPPGTKRGRVRFEEQTLVLPDADGWSIVDDCITLLTAGATKEEIMRGVYEPRAWGLCREQIRAFESKHGKHRGGPWFALVVWLSQRNEEQVAERLSAEKTARKEKETRGKANRGAARKAANGDRRGGARSPQDLPAGGHQASTETLGADPEPSPVSSPPSVVSERVGDDVLPRAPTPGAGQLGLFGGTGADAPREGDRPRTRARAPRA